MAADGDLQRTAKYTALGILAAHVLIIVAGGFFLAKAGVAPPPADVPGFQHIKDAQERENKSCRFVLPTDDIVHLPLRRPRSAALKQLARWDRCDARRAPGRPYHTRSKARTALGWDRGFIAIAGIGFLLAFVRLRGVRTGQTPRWRLAAYAGGLLALAYLAFDSLENVWLAHLIGSSSTGWVPHWNGWLPWISAAKFGAFFGALPLFLVSLATAIGDYSIARSEDAWADRLRLLPKPDHWQDRVRDARRGRAKRFATRLRARLGSPAPARVPARMEPPLAGDVPMLGICCSGGGIRSAAFNLGALQALEGDPDGARPHPGEVTRAHWLSAVSGGSYLAAAWVTAREKNPDYEPRPWDRRSAEEDHLRRHASYLAPGLGGKAWALSRFLFAFIVNALLIGLTLAAVFIPTGWGVDAGEREQTISTGTLTLPSGACVRLPDGTIAPVLADTGKRPTTLKSTGYQRLSATFRLYRGDETPPPPPQWAVSDAPLHCVDDVITETRGPQSGEPLRRGMKLSKGDGVVVHTRPIHVGEHTAAGCPAPTTKTGPSTTTTEPCSKDSKSQREFTLPAGSEVVKADVAILELDHGGIMSKNQILASRCGSEPCPVFHRPAWVRALMLVLLGATLFAGVALVAARSTPATSGRLDRWARRLTASTVVLFIGFYVVPKLVVWGEDARGWLAQHGTQAGGVGVLAVLVAVAAQVAPYLRAAERQVGRVVSAAKRAGSRLRPVLIRLVGAVVGPLLLLLSAIALASFGAQRGTTPGQVGLVIAIAGWLVILGSGADLNEWSLHPFYRDRLRSAFAVDPRLPGPLVPREDPLDDLPTGHGEPRLLICASVNLADDRVTAPGRPVASWVFESGDPTTAQLGSDAMRQAPLPQRHQQEPRGSVRPAEFPPPLIHLTWAWTAVAVSGAAVAPAMGKMTTPERFLLALANVRLGVWYPNPRYLGDPDEHGWYLLHHPRPWYLAKEALGLHKANDRWLYLTDGGHYENLGLVELLRRGCREVYCFDASGDRPDTFGTLAEAMRLAREELNAEIAIDPTPMKPDANGVSPIGVQAATVQYAEEPEPSGWIVIAKLAVPKTAGFDIIDLARTMPAFPNNPTADQLYTDQKFEAYRALGHHLGERAFALADTIRARIDDGDSVADAVAYANTHQ